MSDALEKDGLALLPTAMHPWMDPARETALSPLGDQEVYQIYHRLFDCHTHGWANLQSMHLNLAFAGDEEFGRLHGAVRLLLPLLPALCASSPIMDRRTTGLLDTRLEVYQSNQRRFPAITGDVIPEPIYSQSAYHAQIYGDIEKEIAPHDPERILEMPFLNSRGAIARFDRGTIEIRLMDVQECPHADLAIAEFVVACLKVFAKCESYSGDTLQSASTAGLARLLADCQRGGMATRVAAPELRVLYRVQSEDTDAVSSVLRRLLKEVTEDLSEAAHRTITSILRHGNLATRILDALPTSFTKGDLHRVYRRLGDCLLRDQWFLP